MVPSAVRRLHVGLTTMGFVSALFAASVTRALPPVAIAAPPQTVTLPIAFHVAAVDGRKVVPEGFIEERIARANEIYARYGVTFAKQSETALGAEHAAIENRADRDGLAAEVGAGRAIQCFVVASLRDVDDPKEMRRGVHWHAQTRRGVHFVILSAISGPNVLAHELGHFLGNPKHSDVPGNLMSYQRAEGLPFLDEDQVRRVTLAIRGYLRRGELKVVTAAK